MKYIALLLIRFYQLSLSTIMAPHCRFYPSCSEYTYTAICQYGLCKGSLLGIKRILKCHPGHQGGFDPVPCSDHKHHSMKQSCENK